MKKSLGSTTIGFPTPVFVVGTYDKAGRPNVMTAAWCGMCCSSPPCVAVSLRKATYTYGNIVERRAFTVSIPSESHVKETDYFGIASGRKRDKFSDTGLSPIRSALVDAPYVDQFPLVLECRLLQTLEIGLHTQFIGEIMDVKVEGGILGDDGLPDIRNAMPLLFSPDSRDYYGLGECIAKAFTIGKDITQETNS